MPTPIARLLPQITSLNVADQPYSFYAERNLIVGWWDITKAAELYPTRSALADQSYRLTVTLNEPQGTFDYNETRNSATWGTGYNEDGFKSQIASRSSGKRIQKRFSFTFGNPTERPAKAGGTKPDSRDDPYEFQEEKIKAPLFAWLEVHGWNHQSFIGKFFAP